MFRKGDFLLYLRLVISDLLSSEQVDAGDKELTETRHIHFILLLLTLQWGQEALSWELALQEVLAVSGFENCFGEKTKRDDDSPCIPAPF